jgi:protein gp37
MFTYLDVTSWRPDQVINQPLRWRKARLVRVDHGEGDLFHADVPEQLIDQVFLVIARAPRHMFLILSDYPRRIEQYYSDRIRRMTADKRPYHEMTEDKLAPLANLWLGTRARDQVEADERLPLLTSIPAAIRFVSCEPLIGPVDLSPWLWTARSFIDPESGFEDTAMDAGTALQWVIVGGETGPNARPLHPIWVRDIRIDCTEAGVKFFFSQWGDHVPAAGRPLAEVVGAEKIGLRPDGTLLGLHDSIKSDTAVLIRVGRQAAGRKLDGREWNEMPADS